MVPGREGGEVEHHWGCGLSLERECNVSDPGVELSDSVCDLEKVLPDQLRVRVRVSRIRVRVGVTDAGGGIHGAADDDEQGQEGRPRHGEGVEYT